MEWKKSVKTARITVSLRFNFCEFPVEYGITSWFSNVEATSPLIITIAIGQSIYHPGFSHRWRLGQGIAQLSKPSSE